MGKQSQQDRKAPSSSQLSEAEAERYETREGIVPCKRRLHPLPESRATQTKAGVFA